MVASEEINYKSPEIKGYTVGVAVDPVKIDSLAAFGTPDFVGQRIVDVEKKKDGVIDVQLLKAESLESGGQVFYEVEYTSDTTRGFNHFITRVIVVNQRLFAFTAQSKQKDFDKVRDQMKAIVSTFVVPPAQEIS
ncbi:unnamed protein product [Vitrella brassicaformis CCMP3155]|uniref:PsbP C-terminal domain-containing protein n=1 Tax=Vitrella brassicaformis (strain CCMP3155) TaxID=1169540 RepID=A0A0G4EN49_VITBC|nr:unnamed protein product [Vitrella brassicaformis CCMP3155]|eukprot:CEL98426.1 unnamed protein product [Vitrella brassicaformis CCMP3155]